MKKHVQADLAKISVIDCDECSCRCRLIITVNGATQLFVTTTEFERAFEITHNNSLHSNRKKVVSGLKTIETRVGYVQIFYTRGRNMIQY